MENHYGYKKIKNGKLGIQEQLDLLGQKGIYVDDKDYAIQFLKNNNYYTVMKLRTLLYEKDSKGEFIIHKYRENISFQELVDNYNRNQELFYKIFKRISEANRVYRNRYVDVWFERVEDYTQKSYLNAANYADKTIVDTMQMILNKNSVNKYNLEHGFVPIWIMVDAMSEVQFCELLKCSKDNILDSFFKELISEEKRIMLDTLVWVFEERTPLIREADVNTYVQSFVKGVK